MKKQIITLALTAVLLVSSATVNAATIPRETAPQNATEEQIQIVENLIGGYLDEISTGDSYGMIASRYQNL